MLIEAIRLPEKDETGFTSIKFLADSLKDMGYPMHKKKFVTYTEHLLDLGLVEKTGLYHYPYRIAATRQQLRDVENMFIVVGQTGGRHSIMVNFFVMRLPARLSAFPLFLQLEAKIQLLLLCFPILPYP